MIPVARREMLRAAQWYDQRVPGLGSELLDEIRTGLLAIRDFPLAQPIIDPPFRRALVDRFPYALIYRIEAEDIVIVAVANLKRRPGYWRRRGSA